MFLTQNNNTFHTKEQENVWVQTGMLWVETSMLVWVQTSMLWVETSMLWVETSMFLPFYEARVLGPAPGRDPGPGP